MNVKLITGIIATAVWVGAIVAKHFWTDLDIGALTAAAQATLVGLGVYHIGGPADSTVTNSITTAVGDKSVTEMTSGPAGVVGTRQGGFALPRLLAIVALAIMVLLSGCTAMNAYTSAALTTGAADYASAKKNLQTTDDMKLQGWVDSACAMNVGALQRAVSTSGNSHAVNAVLTACPVPGVGVTSNQPNGSLNVQTTTLSVPAALPAAAK